MKLPSGAQCNNVIFIKLQIKAVWYTE